MTDYLIDVSSVRRHLPLATAKAQGVTGVYVRAAYGTRPDDAWLETVAEAMQAGLPFGGYHFFRPHWPVDDQLTVFRAQALAAQYGANPEDLVPAVDIEDDMYSPGAWTVPSPRWLPRLEVFLGLLEEASGVRPVLYVSERVWRLLGSPAGLLGYRLWVPHYTAGVLTAPPGDVRLWQHRVGALDVEGPGGYYPGPDAIDQSRALGRVPTFGEPE